MTYIVGIKLFGRTALIADTCRTTKFSDGGTSTELEGSIKTGQLFPNGGCIYGLSGRIAPATEFIENLKRHLAHLSVETPLSSVWDEFHSFTTRYAFPDDASFQLLLSSRHSGTPRLFQFNSESRELVERGEEIVAIGSGRDLLDDHLFEIHQQRKSALIEVFKDLSPLVYPYLYCLWLMEYIRGTERAVLRKHGVGGFFHHTIQTATMEKRQDPSIYVITSADTAKRVIIPVPFRVLFASPQSTLPGGVPGDVLIVQKANRFGSKVSIPGVNKKELQRVAKNARGYEPNDTMVFFDSAVWPEVTMIPRSELENIAKETVERTREPQAYFCGFGFANLGHRASFGAAVSSNPDNVKAEFDFQTGAIHPKWQAAIAEALERTTPSIRK
jgi:hypothetical protein